MSGGKRIDFAWELGGRTGHVTTLLPLARAMRARGHQVRFLLREIAAGADLEGAADIPREHAPVWVGETIDRHGGNFAEVLLNFGYHDPVALKELVDAWRERLADTRCVVANVAPSAHLAARTLGIPSFEASQGYHIPPSAMPTPPLRDWEPVPLARLEAADRRVLDAMNAVLGAYGAPVLGTIGELFSDRAMLLTYPELDVYPGRGPAHYYGITDTAEGSAAPEWPPGNGPRTFAYLYSDYALLERLLDALGAAGLPTLAFCRGMEPGLSRRHNGARMKLSAEPMSVSHVVPRCDLVICHGSHQMTAQSLLAGKPLFLLPTQLEQFLVARRAVRFGAALAIAPEAPDADFGAALRELGANPVYAARAREFAERYRSHDRAAALASIIARCEASLS